MRSSVPAAYFLAFGLTVGGLGIACSSFDGPDSVVELKLLQVESVDVSAASVFPPGTVGPAATAVTITVHGWLSDGCSKLGQTAQSRSGNVVTVRITVDHNGTVCTTIAQRVDEPLTLDGTFAPGDYILRVNGMESTFKI